MRLVVDSHTHTIVSGHAYSTMNEMILAAKRQGLEGIALTEHAPQMPGSCNEYYFTNYHILKKVDLKKKFGIEVLLGVEVNIMDEEGTLDLSETVLNKMDVVVASIHVPCYHSSRDVQTVTQAYVKAMEKDCVDIIGHPDDRRFQPDYTVLVPAAKKYGKVLEINCTSLAPDSYRVGARENYIEMLTLCKQYEQPVIVNTDAHYEDFVGRFENAQSVLAAVNFPERLVINTSLERYHQYVCR